jgi:general secretion pathway protein C
VALDSLLKKYFAIVIVALLGVAAYFQAAGATQLVGAAFLATSASAGPARPLPTFPTTTHERRSADAIINSNPFDSANRDLNPKPEESPAAVPAEPVIEDPLSAPSCDGVQAFIITESTDPNWSVAALQGSGEPQPRMRRVGDDVSGKKVAFIGYNPQEASPSVWLESGASICQILLLKRGAPPAQAAAPAPAPTSTGAAPPSTGKGPPAVPADIASKIQKISETEFQIDRSVVDKILENQAELMRSARIVPEQKDGKVVGVRMFGIRPETLLGTLGLQNGDRLESINGFNMASPEKALEAYARLRTASSLNVKVNRRGQSMSIDYQIK